MQEKNAHSVLFILDRLKSALNINTSAELAEVLGVKANTISAWKKRDTIDYGLIITLCEDRNIDLNWLFTGDGEGENTVLDKTPHVIAGIVAEPPAIYGSKKTIPLIPMEALAGRGVGEFTVQDRDVVQRYVVPEFDKADFLIPVKGSSMYPKYYPGDIIACMKVPKGKFIEWNKAYVLDTTQGIMVKRIVKSQVDGLWILRSENKEYQDIEVNPDEEIRHISKVIGVIRME